MPVELRSTLYKVILASEEIESDDSIPTIATERRRTMKPQSLLSLLLPQPGRYATPILIDLNLLVFLAMALTGLGFFTFRADDLLAWGANFRPYIEGAGVLRLLTSTFVHGGFMHLCMNLYGLLIAGLLLEPILGSVRLALAYLITGVAGSIASVLVHAATVSVGASGAIFGLFGLLLVLMLLHHPRVATLRRVLMKNVLVFIGLNLFIGTVVPGIDNAAHIGGFLVGALLGLLLLVEQRARARRDQTPL